MMGFDEETLADLLDFIRREGRWEEAGRCVTTFPRDNTDRATVHANCLELERRGVIRRRCEVPDSRSLPAHVVWESVPRGTGRGATASWK